jgi:hypothetical protein
MTLKKSRPMKVIKTVKFWKSEVVMGQQLARIPES